MILDIGLVEDIARKYNHSFRVVGASPQDVLWGENHEPQKMLAFFDLIAHLRPNYVLHEFFDTRIYNPTTQEKGFRRTSSRNEQQDEYITPQIGIMIKAAQELGYTLVGCDLTHQEKEDLLHAKLETSAIYRQFGSIRTKAIFFELGVPYDENSQLQDAIDPERHQEMVDVFLDFKIKTDKPLVTIVGRHHLESPDIHEKLEGLSYCVVGCPD